MGQVYLAQDPILERKVALKTVAPALLAGKDTLSRFQREARAAARLQHPNIVTIFEVGEVDGTHYIAMEYVEGIDLGEAMSPVDRFTIEQKVRVVVDICRGLDFAHKMGVIHRDVKPANIRLTRDGTVKILDFGIARFRGTDATDPNLTQAGMVLGTPSYLSPELVQGGKVDHHADMWAVGVILYEMLTGRRPFEAPTIASLIHRIVSEPLPALDTAALRLPEALAAVALRALDKDPSRRFPNLGEMAKALLAAIGATPPPDTPLDPVVRKRAYEANFAEARRLLTEDDLSGALEAARSARSRSTTRAPASWRSSGSSRSACARPTPSSAPLRGRRARPMAPRPRARWSSAPLRTPAAAATVPRARRPPGPARLHGAAHPWRRRLPRDRHLRRAARHQGGRALPGGRSPGGGRARTAPSACGTCAPATAPTCSVPISTGAPATTRPPSPSASRPTAPCSHRPTSTGSCTCGTWRRPRRCRSGFATTSPWGRSRSRPTARPSPRARSTRACACGTWGRRSPARRAASSCGSPPA